MNSVLFFDKVSKISLYAIAVLLPIWFLPITQSMVDYQKQALLVVLVFIGFISWLAKMVYEGEVRVRLSWLHAGVLGVLLAFGVSTLLSSWRYGSFWGWPLDTTDNFLAFFAFVLLYFLVSQACKDTKQLFQILGLLVSSATFAVLFALLQMKGIFLVPREFAEVAIFNTLGSANAVAIIAALLLPLALAVASVGEKAWKGVLWTAAILLFSSLMLLDFFGAWIVAIVGLVVLWVFDTLRQKPTLQAGRQKARRISLPMAFVLIALFFIVVADFSIPGAPVKQPEVSPSYTGEFGLIRGLVAESPVSIIAGTGPGTFIQDYAQFRSAETNQGIFWSTRFPSGKAEILDWLLTKGVLGVLSLSALVALVGFFLLRHVMRKTEQPPQEENDDIVIQDMFQESSAMDSLLPIGVLASVSGFVASLFVYPANFSIWFVFWLLVGVAAFVTSKQKRISLASGSSLVALGSSVTLMVILILGVAIVFIGSQKYYAEVVYLQGAQASAQGDAQKAVEKFQSATNANGSVDIYWRELAQLHLQQANQIAADSTLAGEERQQLAGVEVNNAIQAAQQATQVAPSNVSNWNVRGFIYRSLIGVPEADRFAVESYEQAIELEPVSPFPWTELGRVKILSAQAGGNQSTQDAIGDLQKAIELKPDYAPAHYLLAVAHDQLGNQQEAIAKLEETRLVAPNDIGLAFQLGVIYFRQDQLGKARDEFERAKRVNPRYSNARYMLGLTYDNLGRKEDARAEFAAVAALNPDNQEVRIILANLAAGLPALEGIGQPSNNPPIEDNPEEIEQEDQ